MPLLTGRYVKCEICEKEHYRSISNINRSRHFYCSRNCYNNGKSQKELVECEVCTKLHNRHQSSIKRTKHFYCSRTCWKISIIGNKKCLGYKHNSEALENMRLAAIERAKGLAGRYCLGKRGVETPNWKGGLSTRKRINERSDSAYNEWRKQVWQRDNYKCRIGNNDCNGRLEAHHILGWKDHPELRYEVNNGITLCHAHHPRKRAEEKRLSPYFQELVSVSNE